MNSNVQSLAVSEFGYHIEDLDKEYPQETMSCGDYEFSCQARSDVQESKVEDVFHS